MRGSCGAYGGGPRAPWLASGTLLVVQLLVCWPNQYCSALKMIDLDAPESSQVGDTVRLSCAYALEPFVAGPSEQIEADRKRGLQPGERLYAVKWYKDEREFFRFMEQDWPQKSAVLPMEGLTVDVPSSDNQSVVLKQVSLRSSGLFRCEVSTEAPNFVTKSSARRLSVYSLPSEGPVIRLALSGSAPAQAQQQTKGVASVPLPGRLEASCASHNSKPAARLDWIINDWLNLSSSLVAGAPWLSIESRRLFRLTREHESLARALGPPGAPLALNQQFELQLARSAAGSEWVAVAGHNKSAVLVEASRLADYLDQLAETSESRLNLTLGAELVQLLSRPPLSDRRLTSQNNRPATGSGVSSVGGGTRASGKAATKLQAIQLKCVARVLGALLTDSVRLKLRTSGGQQSPAPTVNQQKLQSSSVAAPTTVPGILSIMVVIVFLGAANFGRQ